MKFSFRKSKRPTLTDIAKRYKVCYATMKKWIEPFREELRLIGRALTKRQVSIIYDRLGRP